VFCRKEERELVTWKGIQIIVANWNTGTHVLSSQMGHLTKKAMMMMKSHQLRHGRQDNHATYQSDDDREKSHRYILRNKDQPVLPYPIIAACLCEVGTSCRELTQYTAYALYLTFVKQFTWALPTSSTMTTCGAWFCTACSSTSCWASGDGTSMRRARPMAGWGMLLHPVLLQGRLFFAKCFYTKSVTRDTQLKQN
jgi:hypothetical protein